MLPISAPEAERLAGEAADKMCRTRWRVRYLAGRINRARIGFDGQGRVSRCAIFDRDEGELAQMQVLGTAPVEWLTLHYTVTDGWELPHD